MALRGLSTLQRSISARLVERFIFNFRLSPNSLAEKLPVPWLKPQVINGWSVISFCILKVERLMLRPIPSSFGLETTCCAYRCGVIDCSGNDEPSVYIIERNTDRRFISMMAPAIFQIVMPPIQATMEQRRGYREVSARRSDGRPLFSARVYTSETQQRLRSKVFESLQDFVGFIKDGVSSYARSTSPGAYSRIDLYKEDGGYESVDATIKYSSLDYDWQTAGLEYDSAVRAGGEDLYLWTFKGIMPSVCKGRRYRPLAA